MVFKTDEEKMKFGPAEMAQMMDGAKALLTAAMIFSVVIWNRPWRDRCIFHCLFSEGLGSQSSRTAPDERAINDT